MFVGEPRFVDNEATIDNSLVDEMGHLVVEAEGLLAIGREKVVEKKMGCCVTPWDGNLAVRAVVFSDDHGATPVAKSGANREQLVGVGHFLIAVEGEFDEGVGAFKGELV